MNMLPKIDMKQALNLTRQGRLKEAVALLRGQPSPPPAAPPPSPAAPTAMQETLARLNPFAPLPVMELPAVILRKEPMPPQPGDSRFESRNFSNAAGSRKYKLFIPSGYHGQALPLIVMLHGCTQSAKDFAAGTGMNLLAEAQSFLVAYPEQARGANMSKCWNWFNTAEQRRDWGEPSLIAGITREVMQAFNVRPGRVYIAGMSAGGAAAMIMGHAYPELYAGIGVHSGLAYGAAHDMPSAMAAMRQGAAQTPAPFPETVPTILFHGDQDHTVNIANAYQIVAQAQGPAPLQTTVTQGESGGIHYTRTVYAMRGSQPQMEAWILHGAGHAWSGGDAAGSYTNPRGPHASREMVRFFFQQK